MNRVTERKMIVHVHFFSLNEEAGDLTCDEHTFGPYEFVQMTYRLLRHGPNGDPLAELQDDGWVIVLDEFSPGSEHNGKKFSDFVVHDGEPDFYPES